MNFSNEIITQGLAGAVLGVIVMVIFYVIGVITGAIGRAINNNTKDNAQDANIELSSSVQCANCGRVIDHQSPIFDRILAKYLGFCYECMQDYENKHSSTLDKEKIKLANLVQELQGIGEEQVASFYPAYLIYKSGNSKSVRSLFRLKEREYIKEQQECIASHLNTWVTNFKALEDALPNNIFYSEGRNFGAKVFQVMDANMKALGASEDLNDVSFNVESIIEDIKEVGEHLKNKLVEIDTQGSNMIKNTNDLPEKKKFYYVVFGVLSNMHGVTSSINDNKIWTGAFLDLLAHRRQ